MVDWSPVHTMSPGEPLGEALALAEALTASRAAREENSSYSARGTHHLCSGFLQNLLEKGLSSRDFNESESGLVGGGGLSG